jgi:hypothetical protein
LRVENQLMPLDVGAATESSRTERNEDVGFEYFCCRNISLLSEERLYRRLHDQLLLEEIHTCTLT